MKTSFYSYTFEELEEVFAQNFLPKSGSGLLYNWHYKKAKLEKCTHNLAGKTIAFLENNFSFSLPVVDKTQESSDGTVKFLVLLHDGEKVEMVLLPFQGKFTLCLSSQVGCAMNCSFCYTATAGFTRHLNTEELIGQVILAKRWLMDNRPLEKLLNIVFMGQGEPLHNFDQVAKSAKIMLSQHGLSLAPHKITISTAGLLPGILRFKDEMPPVNIALSLHSPFNEERSQLIPLNKTYPLSELLPHLENIPEGKNRFVTYEYLMIDGLNDSLKHAQALGEMLKGRKAYINLIPFNPFPGCNYSAPKKEKVDAFKIEVEKYNIPTTLRSSKGQDILAACGQLKNQSI